MIEYIKKALENALSFVWIVVLLLIFLMSRGSCNKKVELKNEVKIEFDSIPR